VLCPAAGGALKRTSTGKWAHVLCSLFTPETYFDNSATMETILGIDKIAEERWKRVRWGNMNKKEKKNELVFPV